MSGDFVTGGRHLVKLKPRPNSDWEKRRAVRSVAHHARDASDCQELLNMLGLSAKDGK